MISITASDILIAGADNFREIMVLLPLEIYKRQTHFFSLLQSLFIAFRLHDDKNDALTYINKWRARLFTAFNR